MFFFNFSSLVNHGGRHFYTTPPPPLTIKKDFYGPAIRFAGYYLLLAFNSTFMTDSMYLGTIQVCQNLNERYYCLISTTFVIWQLDANFSSFQLLNMLPFHIRLEHSKRTYFLTIAEHVIWTIIRKITL